MDFYQLEQFKVAAQLEHITKAAEVLNITQPALSRTIRGLEQELGTSLFDHVGKRIVLNEKGRIFLKYAEEMLSSKRMAENEIREKLLREEATIFLSVKACGMMIDDLIRTFLTDHPQVDFSIVQYDTWILKSTAPDLTLFATVSPHVSENSYTLLKERILLAVPGDSPLAERKQVYLREIADQPLVGLQNGSDLAANIQFRYRSEGFEPHFVMDHYTSTRIADMVSLGMGYAYVPEITWPGVVNDKIRLVEVADAKIHRYIHLSWPTSGYMSEAAKEFRRFLMDTFLQLSFEKKFP